MFQDLEACSPCNPECLHSCRPYKYDSTSKSGPYGMRRSFHYLFILTHVFFFSFLPYTQLFIIPFTHNQNLIPISTLLRIQKGTDTVPALKVPLFQGRETQANSSNTHTHENIINGWWTPSTAHGTAEKALKSPWGTWAGFSWDLSSG